MGARCPCGVQPSGPQDRAARRRGERARDAALRQIYRAPQGGGNSAPDAVARASARAFLAQLDKALAGDDGVIEESAAEPWPQPAHLAELRPPKKEATEALSRTALVKLCDADSALEAAEAVPPDLAGDTSELSALDVCLRALMLQRRALGLPLPLSLATSPTTSARCREHCEAMGYLAPQLLGSWDALELPLGGVPLLGPDLFPVSQDPQAPPQWASAGGGTVCDALGASGRLEALLSEGYEFLFVSPVEVPSAVPEAAVAELFAAQGSAACLVEVVPRAECRAPSPPHFVTCPAAGGAVVLREAGQCEGPPPLRHRFAATGSVWLRLRAVAEALRRNGGVLPLPLCRRETVPFAPQEARRRRAVVCELGPSSAAACCACFPPEAVRAVLVDRGRCAYAGPTRGAPPRGGYSSRRD
eukprot:TRINITY_DN35954_c0_g1_i1.p1 TRINITY_DN35954_c0_g1~~TRINITY_DN35954_c0_g1_i1.p1  ORF type:complete len:439 (+),score=116.49 TRINITY_DN35954_c0_g1_i1:67-1317(+)